MRITLPRPCRCPDHLLHADRILESAKAGDLPIDQPMTFEFVVNMKTARAPGRSMAPEIMARATRVIE